MKRAQIKRNLSAVQEKWVGKDFSVRQQFQLLNVLLCEVSHVDRRSAKLCPFGLFMPLIDIGGKWTELETREREWGQTCNKGPQAGFEPGPPAYMDWHLRPLGHMCTHFSWFFNMQFYFYHIYCILFIIINAYRS